MMYSVKHAFLLVGLSLFALSACDDDVDSEVEVSDMHISDASSMDIPDVPDGGANGLDMDIVDASGPAKTDSGINVPDMDIVDASGPDASNSTPDSGVPDSFIPYLHDSFESYTEGDKLPFDAAGRTTANAEQAFRGGQSARMAIQEGDGGGFGQWGGIFPISPAIAEGEEVWVRLYVYWPEDFEFSASPWMKFLRLHNRAAGGENAGYNDLYIHNADGPESVLRTIKEVHDIWAVDDGAPIPRGRWERYEMYLYVDHTSVDDGGRGRVRIWRDGERIFDRTDVPTVTAEGGEIDYFYLFTYWNNEMPPNNYCYIDDLTIATSANPPQGRDEDGNPMIGDWSP